MKQPLQKVLFYLFFIICTGWQLSAAEPPKTKPQTILNSQDLDNIELPTALKEELKKAEEKGDTRFFQEFLNMLFYLAVLIFFVVALLWVLKRLMSARIEQVNETSCIKIIEHRQLTPKTTIYLLGLFGKAVAVADSTNGITFLGEVTSQSEDLTKTGKGQAPFEQYFGSRKKDEVSKAKEE